MSNHQDEDGESYKPMRRLDEDEDEGSEEYEDEDEADTSKCIWKITPAESIYDLSMLRFLLVASKHDAHGHWNCWRIFKVLVLLIFNAGLQLTVVARVQMLVQETRASRVDNVYAPRGNCNRNLASLYSENPSVGLQEFNWDCGPMYPLLFTNASFLDVDKDGFWSEADKLGELDDIYNARFHKEGDLERIFSEFLLEAKEVKFLTQVNEQIDYEQSKALTNDFTRIPMKWMVDQQNISSLCNNVDPELCGNLEVRGILKDHFPNEPGVARRVRKCRQTWDWCYVKFGELFKNYRQQAAATCETVSPNWDSEDMVTVSRYERADKYDPRVNGQAILSPVYQSFLVLVLIIWWLTVLEESRTVVSWWMAILSIAQGKLTLNEDEEKIEVKSLSCKAKVFILILVLLPRIIVIIALSFIGTNFLIIADSYGDLILNSVALGFLIEVDDMLFKGLASEEDQEDIGKLQPIEGEHSCSQSCIDFVQGQTSMLLLLVVFIIPLAMATFSYIMPYGKIELTEAYQCLCHMEGKTCIGAQLFGHKMDVPAHFIGGGSSGRAGKGR